MLSFFQRTTLWGPMLYCIMGAWLSACGGAATDGVQTYSDNNSINSGITTYKIGGTITGLATSGLKLTLNNQETLYISSGSTSFQFTIKASSYVVAVTRQPTDGVCSVSSGSGTAYADVTNIRVSCFTSGNSTAFTIAQLDVAQTQSQAVSVLEDYQALVPGRKALLRAFVYKPTNTAMRTVTASINSGAAQTMACPAVVPALIPPYPIREHNKNNTCYIEIPATSVRSGMSISVTDGVNTINASPRVAQTKKIDLVMVPVAINNSASTALNITQATIDTIRADIQRAMPFATINITTRPTWTTSYGTNLMGSDGATSQWSEALGALDALRRSDRATTKMYFGFVPFSAPTGGGSYVAGLGYVNECQNTSQGITCSDYFSAMGLNTSSYLRTILHELGHNLGLYHAPCASSGLTVSSTDDAFPYAGGALPNVTLYDQAIDSLINPTTLGTKQKDIMGYCNGDWFSDYNLYKLRSFTDRNVSGTGVSFDWASNLTLKSADSSTQSTGSNISQSLLISGKMANREGEMSARINPIQFVPADDRPLPPLGEWTLRLYTQSGATIDYPIMPVSLGDSIGESKRFSVVIPPPSSPIVHIAVRSASGKVLPTTLPTGASVVAKVPSDSVVNTAQEIVGEAVSITETTDRVRVRWNAAAYPWMQLVWVSKDDNANMPRHTIALSATGGDNEYTLPTTINLSSGYWEVSLSNGLNATLQTFARR